MGFHPSIGQLLIILVIVMLIFGTKRLKDIGADLGNALKGFRTAMSAADKEEEPRQLEENPSSASTTAQPSPDAARTAAPASADRNDLKDKV